MKKSFVPIVVISWLITCLAYAALVHADEANDVKEQILLPPKVASFVASKEQQAKNMATKDGFVLPSDFTNYFALVKAGKARAAKKIYQTLSADTNAPAYKTPLKQAALDVELALEAFASGDAELAQTLGDDLMKSLPPGCIYFGGTDPGRGLPTMLCKLPGDPVFVLSQNAFLDGRYMQYIREMYGSKIQLPTTNEVKEIIDVAYANKAKANFNAWNAWITATDRMLKSIIAKNPDREFYYEESFPIDDLSSNLLPHGLIFKLVPEPLNTISSSEIKADSDFWSAKIAQLKNNQKFVGDDYIRKTYAHERTAIASMYARRAQSAPLGTERQRMGTAAQHAFDESIALDSSLPETIFQYASFATMVLGKPEAALIVVQNGLQADPSNVQFKNLVTQLRQMIAKAVTKKTDAIQTNVTPSTLQ